MSSKTSATLSSPANPPRTSSATFETPSGTLYVSRPFKSTKSSKPKALISFTPRKSAFDTTNEASGTNEFRGFFTVFWISMFIFTLRTYVVSIETEGYALNLRFATMFSEDAIVLAISDAILVGSTALYVPFAKAISKGWIKYSPFGIILQHLIQTVILVIAVTWTYHRKWPWVQSGFLTIHSFVMIMKMHSYLSVNGHLAHVSERSKRVLDELNKATAPFGGWKAALSAARNLRENVNAQPDRDTTPPSIAVTPPQIGTPIVPEGSSTSYVDIDTAITLRKRLAATSEAMPPPEDTSDDPHKEFEPRVLEDHPDEAIANLAREYCELHSECCTSGPYPVSWPENITFRNFAMYQLIPTLVYELEYPRTESIRPIYIFEKCAAFFGSFVLLYTMVETFILPLTSTSDEHSFFRLLLDLALPFMFSYFLLFYIIFECICNAFAEISYFADRQFYEDWWNSTSWDDFSRKWNKPVHSFLLRHVYASTISSYNLSRGGAMFFTFLLSACAHELVMVIVTKKIRLYLFLLQLIQIPLIMFSRIPVIKRNKLAGNIVFWLGLYAGFPLLCVAYVAY